MRRGLPLAVGFFAVFGAFMFVFALVAQDGLGLSPLASGLAITPVCVAYFTTSFFVPRLLARFGRWLLTTGFTIEAIGFAGIAVVLLAQFDVLRTPHPTGAQWGTGLLLVVALVLLGIGQALCVGSLFRLVLSEVPVESAGSGSGVLVTTQQTSMAIGVALLGAIFTSVAAASMLTGIAVAVALMFGLTVLFIALSPLLPSGHSA